MNDLFAADDDVFYAARVRPGVGSLGGAFFLSAQAKQAGRDLGLKGWPTYFVGRCGVLGPVDAEVVASICGFFPAAFVRKSWEQGLEIDLTLAVEVYLRACHDWGREHLADFAEVDRLADLAEQAVDGASSVGAPLFAGWRSLPRPEDGPARVAQAMTTLRELRGGLHLAAVLGSGLSPREAIVAGPGGPANAAFFGWAEVDIDEDRFELVNAARAEAERRTDRMVAGSWLALELGERAEFATLLDRAVAVAFPANPNSVEPGTSAQLPG